MLVLTPCKIELLIPFCLWIVSSLEGTNISAFSINCQLSLKRMKNIFLARYIRGHLTLSRKSNDAGTLKSNKKLMAVNLKKPKIPLLPRLLVPFSAKMEEIVQR